MSDYRAPRWLPGGHLQTIYPATCITPPTVTMHRERWDAPDGDFIDVDFVEGLPGKPFIVLFHGLEGSSGSHYARALMKTIEALGWSGAVPHFRGCSGEINRAPRFYHSGDAAEIDWVLRRMASHPLYRNASDFLLSVSHWAVTPYCAGWANPLRTLILLMLPAPFLRRSIWQPVVRRSRAGSIWSTRALFCRH